jgi:hypothetical protein
MIKKRNENGEGAHVKDLLDILLEIQENENSKMKLTRENVKAFIFVSIFLLIFILFQLYLDLHALIYTCIYR